MKIIILLTFCQSLVAGNFFFILYDVGESVNFIPVIEKLAERGEKVEVLLLGTAREKYRLPEELLYSHSVELPTRFSRASSEYIKDLSRHVQSATLVTGVSTLFAKQVHETFYQREDIRLISYWDNLQVSGESDYFKVAHEVAKVSKEILVPSMRTKDGIPRAEVVGYPSLEAISPTREIKKEKGKKLLTYIGSYDKETTYQRAWDWFSDLWSEIDHEDMELVFIHHPKSANGTWEAGQFQKRGNFLFVESPAFTLDYIKASDFILCERTSTAEKAALLGAPVIHILPPEDPYSTALLEEGITKKVTASKELADMLKESDKGERSEMAYKALGIPKNGLDCMLNFLLKG